MISPATLKSWIADGRELAILDAREEGEFGASHMFWAVPCPLSQAPLRAPIAQPLHHEEEGLQHARGEAQGGEQH